MTERRTLLVILAFVGIGFAACAETTPTSPKVELTIERDGDQRWWASSGAVESGAICEGGSHRWIGYRRNDGSPIGYDEAAAVQQRHPGRVLIETQLDCSDGTGAISIAWEPDESDHWRIVDGSGAYAATIGGGRVERNDDEPNGTITLSGEISAG